MGAGIGIKKWVTAMECSASFWFRFCPLAEIPTERIGIRYQLPVRFSPCLDILYVYVWYTDISFTSCFFELTLHSFCCMTVFRLRIGLARPRKAINRSIDRSIDYWRLSVKCSAGRFAVQVWNSRILFFFLGYFDRPPTWQFPDILLISPGLPFWIHLQVLFVSFH